MNDTADLEDFDDPIQDPIAATILAAESCEFRGVPVMLTDAALVAAQNIGLSLFNLDEDKLLDSDNVYPGQVKDAVITVFFCLCEAGDFPEVDDRKKWEKIIRPRTTGSAFLNRVRFEKVIAEFTNEFELAQDLPGLFECFNDLWNPFFKTDVTLPGDGTGEGGAPGKSPAPSEQPSLAKSSTSTGTQQGEESPPQSSI